jgi:hypothetical protein
MQDQRNGVDAELAGEDVGREALALLLECKRPRLWSAQKLGLEIGSDLAATDAVMTRRDSCISATGLCGRRVRRIVCIGWPTWSSRGKKGRNLSSKMRICRARDGLCMGHLPGSEPAKSPLTDGGGSPLYV